MTTPTPKSSQRKRLGASHHTLHRNGTILPGLVVALVVTISCVALVLDRLWLDAATTELRTASEAAALAAAGELISDELLCETQNSAERIATARRCANETCGKNLVAGRPAALDSSPNGDVQFGRLVVDTEFGITRFLQTEYHPRTVRVRCTRQRSRSNALARFFRGITGQDNGDACFHSEVTANNQILGVRPFDGVCVPALPIAILKGDPAGLRQDTWEHQIVNRCGGDEYRYNAETNCIEHGPDGISEIELHGRRNDPSADEANLQLVDLNTELRTEPLLKQFQKGWAPEDLKEFNRELVFHSSSHWMTSSANIDGDHAHALEELIGQKRICLLYSELMPLRKRGYGNLQATDLIAGRIMAVKHNSDGQHVFVFQPTVLTTRTAVLANDLMDLGSRSPAEQQLLENKYIYKLHLTR